MIPGSVPLQLPYGKLLMRNVNQAPVGFNPPAKKLPFQIAGSGGIPGSVPLELPYGKQPLNIGAGDVRFLIDRAKGLGQPQSNIPLGVPGGSSSPEIDTIIKFRAAIKAAQAKRMGTRRAKRSPNFKKLTNVQQKRLTQAAAVRMKNNPGLYTK